MQCWRVTMAGAAISTLAFWIIFAFATSLSSDVQARNFRVKGALAGDLMQACLLANDDRDVETANYVGCCSKELGYCIVCHKTIRSKCYQITGASAILNYQKSNAIHGNDNDKVLKTPSKPQVPRPKIVPDTESEVQ